MTMNALIDSLRWNKKIEMLRIVKGWNQDEASIQCGTTKKNYWLWESGNSYPRLNSRKAISAAFGIPVNEIFNESVQ